MLTILRKWYIRFIYRDQSQRCLEEAHAILLKSARRCAYDLRHAVDAMSPEHWSYKQFKFRAGHWLSIFSPDGIKDYRIEMIDKITALEREVAKLREELQEHGIQSRTPTNNPF